MQCNRINREDMKTPEEILKEHGIVIANCDCSSCLTIKNNHLAAMQEYKDQSEWIAVTDRLPENGQHVLAVGVLTDEVLGGCWNNVIATIDAHTKSENGGLDGYLLNTGAYYARLDDCTHWMPLPTLPTTHEDVNTEPK